MRCDAEAKDDEIETPISGMSAVGGHPKLVLYGEAAMTRNMMPSS